jgi:hypothetical protein
VNECIRACLPLTADRQPDPQINRADLACIDKRTTLQCQLRQYIQLH